MECPNCKKVASPSSSVRCPHCGKVWERQRLEEYEHIDYLRKWLEQHRQQIGAGTDILLGELTAYSRALEQAMGIQRMKPAPQVLEPPPLEAELPKPSELVSEPARSPALEALRAPEPGIGEVAATPVKATTPLEPAPRVAPVPPRPARQPINWSKIWDKAVNFVVSGALLRALLYLGAFMIVVSAAVLVISFWDIFPPILQGVFIFALPTAFYVAGWLTRSRLRLIQAGMVLTGVGEILLAVDFAAVYQFSNLNIDLNGYWLAASLVTTAIYLFTAYRLEGEFFDYLVLIGGTNILVSLARFAGASVEWALVAIPLAGLVMVGLSVRFWERGKAWHDTARAARYLPQVLVPLSLAVILFVNPSDGWAARSVAFLCAAFTYGLLAWKFPAARHLFVALTSFAIAIAFGVVTFDKSGDWLATATAVLSAGYILSSRLLPVEENSFILSKTYRKFLVQGGFALAAISFLLAVAGLLFGSRELEAAIPLTLLALSFCAWDVLLKERMSGYIGCGLVLVAAGVWFSLAHLSVDLYALAYLLLVSFTNLPAGMLVQKIDRKLAKPFEQTGWLAAGLVFIGALFGEVQTFKWAPALTLAVLVAYLAFNTWYHKNAAFAWGAAFVLPVAVARWLKFWDAPIEQTALVWIGLAFVYLLVERSLHQLKGTTWETVKFRLPFGVGIAVMITIGVGVAYMAYFSVQDNRLPLTLIAQGIAIGLVILAARIYHSRWPLFFEPLLSAILVVLSFMAYSNKLFGVSLAWYQYGLILSAVGWLHLLAAAGIDHLKTRYAHGLYLGGYGFLLSGVLVSIVHLPTVLWALGVFILAMGASAVLVQINRHHTWNELARTFGTPEKGFVRLVRSLFVWVSAWLFPLWCALLLVQLKAPAGFTWLGCSLPALLYLPLGTRLGKLERSFSTALFSAAHVFNLVAVFYSVDRVLGASVQVAGSLTIPQIKQVDLYIGQGIIQALAVIFYEAWARMKKRVVFNHLAAWLSILPFTSLLLVLQPVPARWFVIAWAGWAALLLTVGFLFDRTGKEQPRHAHGPYLAGYALLVISLLLSTADRWLSIIVLAICIVCAACSFAVFHLKRHAAFEDWLNFFWRKDTLARRAARLAFITFAAYALPVWLVLLEGYYNLSLAWQGVTLALLAPLYISGGLLLRRLDPDYSWPVYSAGYALTAIGAMIAFADQRIASYVLVLDIAVYAASAVIFRQAFWLYLATCLTPINMLIMLDYTGRLMPQWVSWIFTGLGFLYFGIGQYLDRRITVPTSVSAFALPFYIPGYLLSAIALAISLASNDRVLAMAIFPANILLFSLSAWRMRECLFLYPAAWLSVVPYYLIVTNYLNVRTEWLGATWLPLILGFIALGRWVFHKTPVELKTPRAILSTLADNPAMPFYTISYVLSITMILGSRWTPLSLTIGSALATLLYFGSALLFHHPGWLYPTLLAAHLSLIAYFSINPTGSPIRYISFPFLVLTWIEGLAGYVISRRYPITQMTSSGRLIFKFFKKQVSFGEFPSAGFLTLPSWAQPIFIFVAIDVLVWESVSLSGLETGAWVSAGFFLLLALLAMAWKDQLLAHLSLVLAMTAAGCQLGIQGMNTLQVFASLCGIAFLLYLLSWLVELAPPIFALWRRPLTNTAIGMAALSLFVTLPTIFSETISTAFALGFNGAIYLTMSLRRRTYLLGYLGMGLLLAGWSLFLFVRNVEQPQLYAIPAGLYFAGMGFFEHTRRPGRFALLIESLGLALLLVTSFVQSLDGKNGFPYFILLFIESLLVIWWGAARHVRVPFIAGLAASVINVLAQIVVLVRVYEVNRWLIIFGAGILLVGLGLFVERRREILLSQAQEFRGMLERWD